jgi:hypothetical protein
MRIKNREANARARRRWRKVILEGNARCARNVVKEKKKNKKKKAKRKNKTSDKKKKRKKKEKEK